MSVTIADDEAWALVESSHTGILATIRADGHPVAVPVWFVVVDRAVYTTSLGTTRKVAHLRRDPRASFLVEDGEKWRELRAVLMLGEAEIVEDPAALEHVRAAMDQKYGPYRPPAESLPLATRRHYGTGTVTIRFRPTTRITSWDNHRIDRR